MKLNCIPPQRTRRETARCYAEWQLGRFVDRNRWCQSAMNLGHLSFFSLLATSLLLLGCSKSETRLDAKPQGALMKASEVIKIAERVGESNGMKLVDYKIPKVTYRAAKPSTLVRVLPRSRSHARKSFFGFRG